MAQQQRTISQVVSVYRDQLTNFTHETLNGSMDAVDMRRAHNALVRQLGPQAYYEGLREGGIKLEDADDADKAAISEWLRGQLAHVNQFAADAVAARGDDGKRTGIMTRLGMWIESMQTVGNLGVMSGKKNKMVTWRLSAHHATQEHCKTCSALHGKRHRISWFSSRGLQPREIGSKTLICGGWNCGCGFVDDEGKLII